MKDCNFCVENNLLKGKIIIRNELCYFVEYMDAADWPFAGMIITNRHIATPFELNDEELAAIRDLMNQVKEIFDQQGATGYTIGWNVGEDGGQHVNHAHLHLIARFPHEPNQGRGIRWFMTNCKNNFAAN